MGVFSRNPQTGLATDDRAQFLFPWAQPILGLESESARLTVNNVLFTVMLARPRYYRAAFDGYSLFLEKGPG